MMSDLHDSQNENIAPGSLSGFEDAKQKVENGEADGLGFNITRHDEFLVVEATEPVSSDGSLSEALSPIFDTLGETYADLETEEEEAGQNIVRFWYEADLPDSCENPVTVRVNGSEEDHKIRFSESGWFPVFGNAIDWGDGFDEIREIDEKSLRRVLSALDVLDE